MKEESGWGKPTPRSKWHFFRVGPVSGKWASLCYRHRGRPDVLLLGAPGSYGEWCQTCKWEFQIQTFRSPWNIFPTLGEERSK